MVNRQGRMRGTLPASPAEQHGPIRGCSGIVPGRCGKGNREMATQRRGGGRDGGGADTAGPVLPDGSDATEHSQGPGNEDRSSAAGGGDNGPSGGNDANHSGERTGGESGSLTLLESRAGGTTYQVPDDDRARQNFPTLYSALAKRTDRDGLPVKGLSFSFSSRGSGYNVWVTLPWIEKSTSLTLSRLDDLFPALEAALTSLRTPWEDTKEGVKKKKERAKKKSDKHDA